jgi:transmembrane sensor
MADSHSFDGLIERFINERLTADELPAFFSFLEEEGFRMRYAERIDLDFLEEAWLGRSNGKQAGRLYNNILQAGNIPVTAASPLTHSAGPRAGYKRRFIARTGWLRYAAAVLLLVFTGAVTYRYMVKRQPPEVAHTPLSAAAVVQDISPGGNKAILILGDKSVVSLDSLANGSALTAGGVKIIKTDNGEIRYVPVSVDNDNMNGPVVSNTVRTPRGGQYQLTLSDGTQVWLNAGSSITYPIRFTATQRMVAVSGEVYFEVAENKEKPFIVNINDNNRVEVLGTHFNINAYEDEASVKTTLLEGKVKVIRGDDAVVLRHGQQSSGTRVNNAVDIDQIMAWKNGVFSFEGKTLQEVLRELARWYNLTVVYEKGIPDTQLRGEMGMNLNLSQVIKGLEAMEVNCRLDPGNRLVVSP